MVTEVSPSARMQIVNIGELLAPGACMVCGNGTHQEGYLRLGVFLEWEGEMYLCMTCLTEAAETGGMLSKDEAEYLQGLAEASSNELVKIKKELEAANERLNHFDSLFSVTTSSIDSVLSEDSSSDIEESVERQDSGESVITEPVKDYGYSQPELLESDNNGSGITGSIQL